MGLSGWFRGWFDPIVEFMRPVPPLALIPLVIIWFGIWETGKIVLLFLASLWIMTIAARAGVSGINITKVHAAYSLGASKKPADVARHRAELAAGNLHRRTGSHGCLLGNGGCRRTGRRTKGAGMMIIAASKFQQTDIVLMGIIMIGIIGYGIDILMRKTERWLVPWKGRI